ncbi:hypothetical protein TPAR_07838, partial [Tolypocladium paradoxum]
RLAVHADVGPVVTRAVERTLPVSHETAAQLRHVLEGVRRGRGRTSVFLVVDVDADAGRGGGAVPAHDGPRVVEVNGLHDEAPAEEPAPEEPQVEPHVNGNLEPEPPADGVHQVHIDAA